MANGDTALEQRPRGRPQRLPFDPTPIAEPTFDPTRRVAWLLATSRLLSPATKDISRNAFMTQMRGQGLVLDASRLSRWESGAMPVAPRLLSAYESIVEAAPGSLQAASTMLRRTAGLSRTAEPATHESAPELDEIFHKIERREADGADWLRLASDLAGYERIYLHPTTWSTVCGQLVSELTRAGGVAFLQRYEAAAGLMLHEQGRRFLSLSVGRFVMHPDAQSVAPALTLLREVADDAAGDLVLRLMGGDSKLLRRGAGEVAAPMAAHGSFRAGSQAALEHLAGHDLRKGGTVTRRIDAIDLATRLPESGYERVLASVKDVHMRRRVVRARDCRELVGNDTARTYAEAIATYAEAAVKRAAHDPDQMLRRLVREALFHVNRERRNLAAMMLGLSAYARPVADAVLGITQDDELIAAMAWSLLRRLGDSLDRERVAAVAFAEQRPALRARALVTLGLTHGDLSDPVAQCLVNTATSAPTNGLTHAATFALGMAGHERLDALVAQDGDDVRRAAQWWQTVGSSLHDGTR